eukprot:1362985-Rhodomonas_salina.1
MPPPPASSSSRRSSGCGSVLLRNVSAKSWSRNEAASSNRCDTTAFCSELRNRSTSSLRQQPPKISQLPSPPISFSHIISLSHPTPSQERERERERFQDETEQGPYRGEEGAGGRGDKERGKGREPWRKREGEVGRDGWRVRKGGREGGEVRYPCLSLSSSSRSAAAASYCSSITAAWKKREARLSRRSHGEYAGHER